MDSMETNLLPGPAEITLEILSRLPAESVLLCKRVCKTWQNLIQQPYFADMHLRNHVLQLDDDYNINGVAAANKVSRVLGLLFKIRFTDTDIGDTQLYYGSPCVDKYSHKTLTKINHPPINKPKAYVLVGSCNGLICFGLTRHYFYNVNYIHNLHGYYYDPVYIYNPITREHINLPLFEDSFKGHLVNGFGYHPSSNEYKVVRISYRRSQPTIGKVQVYTLGSGDGWRNIGEIRLRPSPMSLGGNCILLNGALHWLDFSNSNIVSFDLADEKFHVVPSPPRVRLYPYGHCYRLLELRRCLCFVHLVKGQHVDIWLLKKTKDKSKEQENWSWRWSMEHSIKLNSRNSNDCEPFVVTKNDEFQFQYNCLIFSRYDPRTGTFKKIVYDDVMDLKEFQVIPHMNSFVSLKALERKV